MVLMIINTASTGMNVAGESYGMAAFTGIMALFTLAMTVISAHREINADRLIPGPRGPAGPMGPAGTNGTCSCKSKGKQILLG